MSHLLRVTAILGIAAAFAATGASWLLADTAHAGGGCHRGDSGDERGTAVSMENNCFTPSVLRVDAGATVTFTNNDLVESKGDRSVLVGVEHYVASANGQWGNHEAVGGGEAVSYSFADEGTFLYFCALHTGMVGAIVVGDGAPDASVAHAGRTDSVAGAGIADVASEEDPAGASQAANGGDGGMSMAIIGLASGAAIALAAVAGAVKWVRERPS